MIDTETARRALRSGVGITNIGQLTPECKKWLDSQVRAGVLQIIPDRSYPVTKNRYVTVEH